MFQPLKEILSKKPRQDSFGVEVNVCDLWHKYANQVFLSKIIDSQEAISFREGILVISVNNSMFLNEIKRKTPRIVKKINKELKKENKEIKEIKYR
ncbi:hypothetical protein DRH29_00860 [candidate division Kazan bacterium]|uniref:DUF721 domain-containing protein n=1 Tax=candidate division Kazan bacterium TaxID=2202143 RepID=A0A420ZDJ9_UNCK3|nr:MAG: hypothetical protein DRH29_00860 [candidate division Kazan bacterium]